MKKLSFLFAILMIAAVSLFAQAPQKFSYQAVVRNANNQLVTSQAVGVRVSILQGGVSGTVVYMETQTAVTNANGLITLQIGGGNVLSGNFATIDWSDGPFFLKTETDPTGGTNYSIEGTQQLLSVPYALYAGASANGFSGDYNDLSNLPQIPQIPQNVSAFNNDAGYLTGYTETDPTVPAWAKEANKPAYSYSEITNTPTIPTVPANVSAFTNDAGYITMDSIPVIPTVPTNVSAFTNDAGYITMDSIPIIPTVPTNVSAFTNDAGYITMDSIPEIPMAPTNVSSFTNDAGYITMDSIPAIPTVPTNVSAFTNDAGYITMDSIPTIPTVPTNVSALTNDAGYITIDSIPAIPTVPTNVSAFTNDAGYITMDSIPTIPTVPTNVSAFTNDAGYITMDSIPTVPTNVSVFNNDAGYITMDSIPAIPAVPTNVSAFANDAGYITMDSIPAIPTVPTNISVFNNDAHYITNTGSTCNNEINLCDLMERLELLENRVEPIMIQTEGVIAVTEHSFTVNGKVLASGDTTVSERGFVYSTNHNPSLSENHVANGSGIGSFTTIITGLTAGTTYYVRAYAMNQSGTYYGNEVAVTTTAATPSSTPSITTIAVTNITTDKAIVTGAVTSDGGETVMQRGFVYDTLPNPTTNSSITYHGTGTGQFSNLLSPLLSGKTYFVRAFATNSVGTAYGNELSFATSVPAPVAGDAIPCSGTPIVTDHEGNIYNTVQIGTQCWTKENLRTTTSPSTGTYLIPPAGTLHTCSGKQARWYNDDSTTYAPRNYGLLYNWNAAMDTFNTEYGEISMNGNNGFGLFISGNHRGICPEGWHIPSSGEWDQLIDYIDNHIEYLSGGVAGYVAKALASTIDWNVNSVMYAVGNDLNANNVTGFNALPAGQYQKESDSYSSINSNTYFWSTSYSANGAHAHTCIMGSNNPSVIIDHAYATNLCSCVSVRCLRD